MGNDQNGDSQNYNKSDMVINKMVIRQNGSTPKRRTQQIIFSMH